MGMSAYVCSCDGCWACAGRQVDCTCDVDWDAIAEARTVPADDDPEPPTRFAYDPFAVTGLPNVGPEPNQPDPMRSEAQAMAESTSLTNLRNIAHWAYRWYFGRGDDGDLIDSIGLAVMHGMPRGPLVRERLRSIHVGGVTAVRKGDQ